MILAFVIGKIIKMQWAHANILEISKARIVCMLAIKIMPQKFDHIKMGLT